MKWNTIYNIKAFILINRLSKYAKDGSGEKTQWLNIAAPPGYPSSSPRTISISFLRESDAIFLHLWVSSLHFALKIFKYEYLFLSSLHLLVRSLFASSRGLWDFNWNCFFDIMKLFFDIMIVWDMLIFSILSIKL